MSTPQKSFLDLVLQRWQDLSTSPQLSGVVPSVSVDRSIGKMGIEFQCDPYLIMIGAWENGRCLDIDVMRIQDKSISMLSAGPCHDDTQVDARLEALCHLLNTERVTSPNI